MDGVGTNGQYTSIATDSSNRPHISYDSSSDGSLRYAVLTAGGWFTETVDSGAGAGVGQYTSIALDNADHPHISYYDTNNKALKYAHWDGSTWTLETVDATAHVGMYSSIALDSNDGIYIAHYDETNRDLKLATRGGTPPTPSPNLGVTKTAAPTLVSTGAPVTYTITFSNSGQVTAIGVVITDVVPVNLTNVNYSSSGAALTARTGLTYTWDVSDLAPGTGGVLTVTGNVTTSSAVAGATFTNTVIATAIGDTTPSNNTASAAVRVRANYTLFLSLIFGAGGTGTVRLAPPGIDCSSDCAETYEEGTAVSLIATENAGSTFGGWDGACSGTINCAVTMDDNKIITATFFLAPVGVALTQTVGTTPAVCPAVTTITVLSGTPIYYCYTVQNMDPFTWTHHALENSALGTVFSDMPYDLGPGQTANTVDMGLAISRTADLTSTTVATWTASLDSLQAAAANAVISMAANAQGTVNVVTANLAISVTVGTEPGQCSSTQSLDVPTGTQVYFCVLIRNTGSVTLTNLVLKVFGQDVPLSGELGFGQEVQATGPTVPALGPITVTEPLSVRASVTADGGGSVQGQYTTESIADATVAPGGDTTVDYFLPIVAKPPE